MNRVVVVTVTYGNRWRFLSQVVEAVMKDSYVTKLVIVDNGSKNKQEIENGTKEYGNKVIVLRQEKNLGSAGGFAVGLDYVRGLDCDFVFTLDDDNLPEEDAIEKFLENRKLITEEKVVLVGHRINLPGATDFFYKESIKDQQPKGTFFEVFSLNKIRNFFNLTKSPKVTITKNITSYIMPNESFVYGGAFIPVDAVRNAPLPDASLVLYGDDIEYSWGIKRLGYSSYACYSPKIFDIELSFGDGSQVVGLFDSTTQLFKVYYRIRNMVRISIRNTKQNQIMLLLNIIIWMTGLCILGFLKYCFNKSFLKRIKIILQAVYDGYVPNSKVPDEAKLP